ncbi:protein translocase subunit yajC [Nitrosomonas cryotolerans]|uniref:Sec translocon accessory complex subunit YajC n=1 Tax=Nitrosomonas cryotolerans ATCC 49181 TaxID=1131553 RepID=A0A1N6I4M8_9PROT|nr:preprotein translocase subunit YajC [Nitrosomonas cryotolerans]SFQ12910.1 protein translocase subunit yajC [Nitrosomonas cryotolerans]SIO26997.1 protein translocase subunit yajC [Nitrosomonas cryotolerans ATCC 49181]
MLISEAFAQAAAPAQAEGSLLSLLPLFGILILFYFLLIRPQSKRAKEHKQMTEALQRGDEIITSGGALGRVNNVSESYIIMEIAPNVEVTVLKSAVQTLLPKGTLKSIEPSKGGKTQKNNKLSKTNESPEIDKPQETKNIAEASDDDTSKNSEKTN